MTKRLIETWLPIAALGEESVRERRSMTALPPTYYLHVWWARRPLVASRAAILASLLPADANHEKLTHMLGIHGDPVASRKRIGRAKRSGERFEGEAYTYPRAFSYVPSEDECKWMRAEQRRIGIDDPSVSGLDQAINAPDVTGFDIDEATLAALEELPQPPAPYTLDDLNWVLSRPELMPPGIEVKLLNKEFSFFAPGLREAIRVTTDPDFYEENPESVEFWTPGNPLFPKPTGDLDASVTATTGQLSDLLTRGD